MASEYTTNYNLDKYVADDKPNLRDQYNSAMDKIDTQMKVNADGITTASTAASTAQNAATAAQTAAEAAQSTATAAQSAAEAAQSTAAAAQSAAESAQTAANTAQSVAEAAQTTAAAAQSTATAAQSAVSSLESEISGKAPTNHASTATTYGVGTNSNYGHVKVLSSYDGQTMTNDGQALGPEAAYGMYWKGAYICAGYTTASIPSGGTITQIPITSTKLSNMDGQFSITSNAIQISNPGTYLVIASVFFSVGTQTQQNGVYVYQGSSAAFSTSSNTEIGGKYDFGGPTVQCIATPITVTNTSYITVAGRNGGSSAVSADASSVQSFVMVVKLS